MGDMIDRITYLGAAELFLEKEASLLKSLTSAGVPTLCIGAVLERQIDSLEASKWKPEIQRVIACLLDDLLVIYTAEYPIRRARVILRLLEHSYFTGSSDVTPDELGDQTQSLLSSEVSWDLEFMWISPAETSHSTELWYRRATRHVLRSVYSLYSYLACITCSSAMQRSWLKKYY